MPSLSLQLVPVSLLAGIALFSGVMLANAALDTLAEHLLAVRAPAPETGPADPRLIAMRPVFDSRPVLPRPPWDPLSHTPLPRKALRHRLAVLGTTKTS